MAATGAVSEHPRGNRRDALLNAAARSFAQRGYDGASVRNIAAGVGVQPSSLYYFFRATDHLLEAVYERGVSEIMAAVEIASASARGSWTCLERAAVAYLESLLDGMDRCAVVARIVPRGESDLDKRLIRHRREYERLFAAMIDDLPLAPRTDERVLRLTILGALNCGLNWYRPGGDTPAMIAGKIVGMFRRQLDVRGVG
jgi:AcrR family transcriptional regulator